MNIRENIFIPGTEWLYYKLYTGFKTADLLLVDMIRPISEKLVKKKIIDQWFFIRYADPDFHLRVRFHLRETKNFDIIMGLFSKYAEPFLNSGEIYRVQADTYQREISRYGKLTMEFSEKIFFFDSNMVLSYLKDHSGDGDYHSRWLFALKAADSLLNTFNLSPADKLELMKDLNMKLSREYNKDRNLAQQISKKYRKEWPVIDSSLNGKDRSFNKILDPMEKEISVLLAKMKGSVQLQVLEMRKKDLLASYIHMMMNRIFSSRQGQHEMLIYDILFRYYKSVMAKKSRQQGS